MGLAVAGSAGENDAVHTTVDEGRPVLPVLLYHDVADGPAGARFRRYVVTPSLFDEHMSALASAGYRGAHATEVADREPGDDAGTPTVHLTFDDGYRSFAAVAVPTMARYGLTGTVFVPTAYIGGPAQWLAGIGEDHRQLMSWAEIGDVVSAGAEVGAHGHRHLAFDLVSRRDLWTELFVGRATLEDRLGVPVQSLAYPFGFHHHGVRDGVRAQGYKVAFEVGDDLAPALDARTAGDRALRVRRIVVDGETSGEDLLDLVRHGRRPRALQQARCMARPGHRLARRLRLAG